MGITSTALLVTCHLAIVDVLLRSHAHAQTITGSLSIALKSGESIEIGDIYFISNCKSLLKSTPQVEILDGPPAVAATIKEAMVLPRRWKCANPVTGGKLFLTAKDIEDPSYTNLTLRIIYNTRDGERKFSYTFNLSLIP